MTIMDQTDMWSWALRHYEPWTIAEEVRLAELLRAGRTVEQIAHALRRRPGSIKAHMDAQQIGWRQGRYSLNRLAEVMGVDTHSVMWWRDQGWLPVHRAPIKTGRHWACYVDHDDLVGFLENEDHWHLWEPERIADSTLREWALELRAGIQFLGTAEVGERLCLTHYGVSKAIREGRIRAVKRGANWLIRSDWLCLAQSNRSRGVALTDAELAHIRLWWGRRSSPRIACELGRAGETVCRAARRLGLPRLGREYWRSGQKGE